MAWNDLIGRRLDHYVILEEIGRGGSSRVYRALDEAPGAVWSDVAIKALPNDTDDRVGFVRRFEREAQAVAQLHHPNIVAVLDRGETAEYVYLVMPLIAGGTLRQRLGRPLAAAETAMLMTQMATALHHAHLRGIIHRDVKPSNMLVDAENPGHLLLTDFGIAKIQGARGLTKSGTTIGTPEYMAPEQAEGKEIDPRADVYSLGCVLYECLAGRPPFVGSTPVSVLYQQVHSRPAYIRGFNSEIPRELARVVELALAKRPEERYGTAERLAQALAPFAEGAAPQPSDGRVSFPVSAPIPRPSRDASISGPPFGAPAYPSSYPSPYPSAYPSTPASPFAPPPPDATPLPPFVAPPASPSAPPFGGQPMGRNTAAGGAQWSGPAADFAPGLGAEGLDALFPDDPEAQQARDERLAAEQGYSPELPPPETPDTAFRRPAPRESIPLPNFRLPAKQTRPLQLPMTQEGLLDVEALLAEVERRTGRPAMNQASQMSPEAPGQAGGGPLPGMGQRWRASGQPTPPSQPFGQRPSLHERREALGGRSPFETGGPQRGGSTPLPAPEEPAGDLNALFETGAAKGRAESPWRPVAELQREQKRMRPAAGPRRLPHPALIGALALVLIAALAATWISFTGLGVTMGPKHATPIAHSTATATLAPTDTPAPTATPGPTATPTLTAQQQLDQQAAASFSAVTLARFDDGNCGTQTTQFSGGENVYVNLCAASDVSGVTVQIRQGGQVVATVVQGVSIAGGQHRGYYRYGLGPGSYEMVVLVSINGSQATARDLTFTMN